MGFVKAYAAVPDAELDFVPFCGATAERAIVQAAGYQDRIPHRKGWLWWFWQIVHPELPVLMQWQLKKHGYIARRQYVLLGDRLDSLHEFLGRKKAVVVWVRQNDTAPIAAHMITILGYEPQTGEYLVVNCQKEDKVERSHTEGLEAGNVIWDEAKLLRRWRNASWRRNAALLVLQ